ncbi:protein FAM169B-like isoform X2 [Schistocerca americana]|uniref:protein FAM169B-like isoform X2 n=1 Tax=Schistocerca americana TaxID=7009 RepID=UPI001F4FC108|nr:protein FAM169B-like isoform X2 [Schistocerca americana]XP_049937630.1 protein FAM169B-like isoform X2 [Schistocerca serialis cubense]
MALATDYSPQLIKCKRCHIDTPISRKLIEETQVSYSGEEVSCVRTLKCSSCSFTAGLFINGEWMTLDDILSDKAKEDGCFQAKSSKERAVHFIMSQIFYQELESPDALEMEAVFDLPDFTDDITILWQNGTAVGFYSTKQKGVTDERTAEQYPMVTLDSIYVSPFHRRCGAATKLLEHLAATHCDQDIAVSTPISSTMRKVLKKFLAERPTYRRKFWEVEGTGQEGDRKLIWYSLLRKERLLQKTERSNSQVPI